jgi:indolepyruvate ferredoxin oxidoreductase, beta subunit
MTGRATSVVLAGVAGQPVVKTARLLAEAATQAGHDASFAEVPSALECGGPISAHVRFGPEVRSALVGERRADVLVGFEQLEALRASHLLAPHGFAAVSELLVPTWRMRAGLEPAPDVIARLAALTPRVAPVPIECLVQPRGREPCAGLFLLGLVSPLLPLPEDAYLAVFRASSRAEADACRLAFGRGRDWFASLPERVTAAALQPLDIAGERR